MLMCRPESLAYPFYNRHALSSAWSFLLTQQECRVEGPKWLSGCWWETSKRMRIGNFLWILEN